ncbi:MoxR family ATPase [Streptomyces sp. NPDC001985]|uniref:ATPase n=1 Tax=Streptomyces sp. NPDC001985 TaxID=3154406 RepID=UPI00332C0D6A
MTWNAYYTGDGTPRDVTLAGPPPWRTFPRRPAPRTFQPPEGLTDAVNAALYLRRPLLITGSAGTGKSTVVEQVAAELKLGPVLRWHITSRSTLAEALCGYDALAHIHALRLRQMAASPPPGPGDDATRADRAEQADRTGQAEQAEQAEQADEIAPFLRLGPLGTALLPGGGNPRALLIDEIDKSDLDLPSDLLDVLERGEFEIPELARRPRAGVPVRTWDTRGTHPVTDGVVRCSQFPFIVMTSNGERDFAPPFLRRCIRYAMPAPTADTLRRAVEAHLGEGTASVGPVPELIEGFAARIVRGEGLAVDQLLNAVALVTDDRAPGGEQRERLLALLTQRLNSA